MSKGSNKARKINKNPKTNHPGIIRKPESVELGASCKAVVELSENYRIDRVIGCLERIFDSLGGISSYVKPGMRVALKPNLLMAKKPEDAATTHPAVVRALTLLLQKAGASVIIVESPGGPYNPTMLKRVYAATGMEAAATETGAELNYDVRVGKKENTGAKIVKSVKVLKPLLDADLIINLAKLKTHGLMVYTGAVKNMFGSIAGMEKADFHMRFTNTDHFAECLIDIFLATRPQINLIDGIIAMEGEGPGSGVPKYLGVMIGSTDAFAADYAALKLIDVDYRDVPVMKKAEERGLFSEERVELAGVPIETVMPDSFDVPSLERVKHSRGVRGKLLGFLGKQTKPKPEIRHEKCIACGKCIQVCPPHTIKMGQDKKVVIDYSRCISCLCCHEFCPEKAIRIRKNILRSILEYRRT